MDRPNKGISRRGVLVAAAGAVALTAVNQPTQAVAITAKTSLGPLGREERAVMARHVNTL